MDEGEIFNMYHEIPSVAKGILGTQIHAVTEQSEFKTGTTEDDRDCSRTSLLSIAA